MPATKLRVPREDVVEFNDDLSVWSADIKDSDEVRCSGCGASAGTYGELKETAIDAAKGKLNEMIGDLLKRR
ncbi:hypothetical protein [Burkholderia cenocepacia]|uniref:hypothetical protein n=1 Tax=Burkholderia cenocepacia TaxID=95486 RepID=UPI000F5BDF6E|nr:hypothetical protein [Burkholderia cenocepacia]